MVEPLKICYASDDAYIGQTTISAVSLLKHNPGAHIYLLGANLKAASIDIIRDRVEKNSGKFLHYDITDRINNLVSSVVNTYTSSVIYARIFIPELINEDTRILYLDCDTLVNGSLEELFKTDLHGHAMALGKDCIHPVYKNVISHPKDKPYYNSGVLLMDLAAWRKKCILQRFMDELKHPHGRICLPDQDIINRALGDEIEPLDARWNFLSQNFLANRHEKAVIYHFSGNTLGRPWFTSSRHPLREAYRKAAMDAGLPKVAEQRKPMPFEYKVQYLLYRLLPKPIFTPVSNLMYRIHIWKTYGV